LSYDKFFDRIKDGRNLNNLTNKNKMINKDKFIKAALIIAIILLMVLVYISFGNKVNTIKNPYSAVFLRTGDMYFGKLSRFPKLTLSDVWFLQVSNQEDQAGFNLAKFSNAMFGPQDKMELSKENIVWISKLADDSQVVSFILQSKNSALQSAQTQAVPQPTAPAPQE
jgi:hypothetical protein